jgi:hypothetical protein
MASRPEKFKKGTFVYFIFLNANRFEKSVTAISKVIAVSFSFGHCVNLSVLLRFTDSGYSFGFFELFLWIFSTPLHGVQTKPWSLSLCIAFSLYPYRNYIPCAILVSMENHVKNLNINEYKLTAITLDIAVTDFSNRLALRKMK